MSETSRTLTYEDRTEALLRRVPFAILAITTVTAALLYAGIGLCLSAFAAGHWSVALLSGLMVQAFGIILVHDGSHRAITRTAFDSVLMNLAAGLLLLPFYGELFRKYHLIHHGHTNEAVDPLWPAFKKRLYVQHRRLFMVGAFIPSVYTLLSIARGTPRDPLQDVPGPRVRPGLVLFSFTVALATAWWIRPPLTFLALTALSLSMWGTLRHWCEHIGSDPTKDSNTFRFPLGMGIGNHDTHHEHPSYSWISLAVGLVARPKDTDPIRTVWSMLSRPEYQPYSVLRESR